MSDAQTYLSEVAQYFADEHSSEHSYRTAFQNYLATLFPNTSGYRIQQDPKAIDGNKPDYIVLKNSVPLLYIEVKKVGEDLNKIESSHQAKRYFGYTNLIISDYVEFRFFRNGERYDRSIALGTIDAKHKTITPHGEHAEQLEHTIADFVSGQKEPIKHGKHLAKIMGGKAQRIRENIIVFLQSESTDKDELVRMQRFLKENLIEHFTDTDFADMYAQTLVYGLFAARYNDYTLNDFSRQEARDLVPKTNPFLKNFFEHISGSAFPKRLEIIVDELCEVFSHADVRTLMQEYFKKSDSTHESPDPVIHFYEDFLKEYDETKKMDMGVFYTPLPVVRCIVRGIDDLLKQEFGVAKGLADTQKIIITKTLADDTGKNKKHTHELHRVQVLDFATGTGTFLNETIRHIHETHKAQQGRWDAYVQTDLLPRLHGFELMMASYTIAHLKLAMTLQQTGVTQATHRLGVYLTNTLDDAHTMPLTNSLFGAVESIAQESRLASQVKNDTPIMVIMGNPPYSGESQNPHYTGNDVYKVEPGGKEKLRERNSKWLNDDYVKFIRFAESMIEKNGEGIMGLITAHGYIDNPTFRGMRWHLRNTFDALYVIDLHGNSNKKETTPNGGKDENVFDIKTGVSIIFGTKKKHEGTKTLATVHQADMYGIRADKFKSLDEASIQNIKWNTLPADADVWRVEGEGKAEYEKGFSVANLFLQNSVGIATGWDYVVLDKSKKFLEQRINDFCELDINTTQAKYGLNEKQKKKINYVKSHLFSPENVSVVAYRPFDNYFIYYDENFIERSRRKVMSHLFCKNNIGLVVSKYVLGSYAWNDVFVVNSIVEFGILATRVSNSAPVAPLYLYDDHGNKTPNLNTDIVNAIQKVVGVTQPEDVFDYVYAALHSPTYRKQYKEFLKSDFPRVPYPSTKDMFWQLVKHGCTLRQLHLLQHPTVNTPVTTFPAAGSDTVEKVSYKDGRVYINTEQYWDGVPQAVWDFYIGGYQPAQKYLKDRKGKKLTSAEFENYEKMVVALKETLDTMHSIDSFWQ